LSNYRPKEFGSATITLTVDGGQHLRSPGKNKKNQKPELTKKNVESIFGDPVFDHKTQALQIEKEERVKKIS
jgi:hypothetical protein